MARAIRTSTRVMPTAVRGGRGPVFNIAFVIIIRFSLVSPFANDQTGKPEGGFERAISSPACPFVQSFETNVQEQGTRCLERRSGANRARAAPFECTAATTSDGLRTAQTG